MSVKKKAGRSSKSKTVLSKKKSEPMARRKKVVLGRGLSALIEPEEQSDLVLDRAIVRKLDIAAADSRQTLSANHAVEGQRLLELPVSEIVRSPWQPRQTFDKESLQELAESIRANGVIQPLICRRNSEGKYELIAGERRLRAAIEAEVTRVPVILTEAEDRRAAEMAIIENIQRQDLNPVEEAEGYRTLADSFDLTQQEVAERVGKARATVANSLRLLELPDEVRQLVGNSLLSVGHAKVLLGVDEMTEQIMLARKCVTDGLTVRALERHIKRRRSEAAGEGKTTRAGISDLPESYVRDLCDRLHRHFGTAVRLTPGVTLTNGRHVKGLLEIDFYNNDDLDRLLELFGIELD